MALPDAPGSLRGHPAEDDDQAEHLPLREGERPIVLPPRGGKRSAPTIGDIAQAASSGKTAEAAGRAQGKGPAGAGSGAWTKTASKPGLAGLFSALFGQALAGAKGETGSKAAGSAHEAPTAKAAGREAVSGHAKPRLHGAEGRQIGAEAAKEELAVLQTAPSAKRGGQPSLAAARSAEEGGEAESIRSKGGKKEGSGKDEKLSPNLLLALPGQAPGPEPKSGPPQREEGEGLRAEGTRSSKHAKEDPGLAARIQIVDQRRIPAKPAAKAGPEPEAPAPEGAKRRSAETRPEEGRQSRDLSLDLLKPGPLDKGAPSREGAATAAGQNFSALLADRLRDSGNTEIVQSARILLKDGDAGTIRMRLNPPELGNVKIELHLADNSISGRIVVDSDAARSAFEKGMAQLQDAFRSGGFESARLEVQVGSGDAGGQGAWNGGGRGAEGPPEPFWSERSRSAAFEASSPSMSARPGRAERALDIVV